MPRALEGRVFAVLAVLLPSLLWLVHRGLGHQGDQHFFHEWYLSICHTRAFYRDGPGVNYPILGALAVGGPACVVEHFRESPLDFALFRTVFKATIVASEVLFIWVFSTFSARAAVASPRVFSLGVYVLPAVWSVGAWFGQLEPIGSTLLCLCFLSLDRWRSSPSLQRLMVALAWVHAAVLTKQLLIFAFPAWMAMFFAGLRADRQRVRSLLLAFVSCAVWFVVDPWLALPGGFRSHLAHVWFGGGSAHADLVSGGGANLWSVLAADPGMPSAQWRWLSVSVRSWGALLFLAHMGALLLWWYRRFRRSAMGFADYSLLVGASYLSMGIFLTGVHERYLPQGIPFLLVGVYARSRWLFSLFVLLAIEAGLYVLGSIHWDAFSGVGVWVRSHRTLFLFEALAYGSLCAVLLREECAKVGVPGMPQTPWCADHTPEK